MESTALQQAFDTCQNNKAAWLQRKNELAAAEQEYLRLLSGEGRNVSRLDEFRPDAASVDDSREKFTPAQNMIFSRKSAQLASRQSV